VFLLRAGVPTPSVLGSLALIVAIRFAIRPLVLVSGKRWGLKPLLIAGTVLTGIQFPILAEIHGLDWALLVLCVITAVGDTLYWTCYHAYFASAGDSAGRGRQIGAREALASTTAIAGPIAVGSALVTLGPRAAFGAMAIVNTLAAWPLLHVPNIPVIDEAPG